MRFAACVFWSLILPVFSSASAGELLTEPHAIVKKHVHRLLATESSRADIDQGLTRLKRYRRMFEAAADRHGVPRDLVALVLIETRVRNLAAEANHLGCCSGLWQLDADTARSLGLKVDAKVDERLDPRRATDAAMRYVAQLKAELGTWPLAVAAYNIGPTRMRRVMRTSGIDDPWTLAEKRLISPYLVKVAAATLILEASSRPAPGGMTAATVLAAAAED